MIGITDDGSIVIELAGNGDVVVTRMMETDVKNLVFVSFNNSKTQGKTGDIAPPEEQSDPKIHISICNPLSFDVFLEAVEAMKPHARRIWGWKDGHS